jgi:hypothetical protein
MSAADAALFRGCEPRRIAPAGAEIRCVIGGGLPLLLQPGHPHSSRRVTRGKKATSRRR